MMSSGAALGARVAERTGQNPFRCYQCGNCSAGCPTAGQGDLLPHQVFRLLQLGDERSATEVLNSVQPWLCVGCQTCAARCPQDLDLSRVMDALRLEARLAGSVPPAARRLEVFQRTFVEQVMAHGRLNEMQLGVVCNLRNRRPMENAGALLGLFRRGKLKPWGRRVAGPKALRQRREP